MKNMTCSHALVIAAVALGMTAPASAQVAPKLEQQLRPANPPLQPQKITPPAQAPGPIGPGLKSEDLSKDKRTIGVPGKGPTLDISDRLPGAGGGAAGPQQPAGAATPTPTTLVDPSRQPNRPDNPVGPKGKEVGPGYFKTKEEQLLDLAKPTAPKDMKDMAPPPGGALKTPGERGGPDVLGGLPTTVTKGAGKNQGTQRDQQKDDPPGTLTVTSTDGLGVSTSTKTFPNGRTETTTTNPHLGTREVVETTKDGWTVVSNYQHGELVRHVITYPDGRQEIEAWNPTTKKYDVQKTNALGFPDKKKTPDPQTDTGGTPVPEGGVLGAVRKVPKDPGEVEAERRRQVTLPGEGPALPEPVHAAPKEAVKEGIRRQTDGRIDPADPAATTPGGARTAKPEGSGCVQVDCLPKPGAPGKSGGENGPPGSQPPSQ